MRILFVLEHFYPYIGGVETLFWELSTSLVRQGHQVGIVTTQFHQDLASNETLDGVEVHRIPCKNRFLFSFLSIPAILKLAGKYDLIQTTSYNAAFPAMVGAIIKSKPIVITFHEVWGKLWQKLPFIPFPKRVLFQCWEWFILKLPFDRFIAVSNATHDRLLLYGIPPNRLDRVYNGIDYDVFSGITWKPATSFTYTYFGRLGSSKGLNLLLEAATLMATEYPESRLKLIIPKYPTDFFGRILQFILDNKIEKHVILLHDLPKNDLFEEIAQSSCVVIPSYSEGFCFVAAEATAIGVPIISSQKMALAEVVGGNVVIINSLTAKGVFNALKKAIRQEWEILPRRRFEIKDAVMQYESIYNSLLAR